jgi:hypothetical protein
LAPGSGAFLSASAFGAGIGEVVAVWAPALSAVAQTKAAASMTVFIEASPD